MMERMEILSVCMQKGIHVYAVKSQWQLDDSMQSKIIAMAFAMASEIKRGLISQRTKEALRAKKAAGVRLGRPKGPANLHTWMKKRHIHRPKVVTPVTAS